MTTLTEADVEQVALDCLAGLGWGPAAGTDFPLHPRNHKAQGRQMTNRGDDLRQRILSGRSDANIRFDDLRLFLLRLGFAERVRGSHHIFRRDGVRERINLQRDGSHAKPYQVRQVRQAILRYWLEEGN